MPVFTLLFCALLIAAFIVLWAGSLGIHLLGWALKKRWLKWLGGVPLVAFTLLGFLALGLGVWEVYASHSPAHVFKESFGFAAPQTVKFTSGYSSMFGDSGSAEVIFTADEQTLQTILKSGFVETTRDEYSKERNIEGSPTRFFKKEPFGKHFTHDVAFLAVDDVSGRMSFHWNGID